MGVTTQGTPNPLAETESPENRAAVVTKSPRGICQLVEENAIVQLAVVFDRGDIEAATDAALALYKEIAPSSALEALLATQMAATHHVALEMLRRTMVRGQTSEATDKSVNRATKLMRTFTSQVETLERLRGKTSEQKVTVEHVHVHEGGQAVVGNVTGGGEGDGKGK